MRQATRDFACGKTGEALAAYSDAGMVHAAQTRAEAPAALIDRWDAERRADPAVSRMFLTHLNKEAPMPNQAAPERLAANGEFGDNITVLIDGEHRHFAKNARTWVLIHQPNRRT